MRFDPVTERPWPVAVRDFPSREIHYQAFPAEAHPTRALMAQDERVGHSKDCPCRPAVPLLDGDVKVVSVNALRGGLRPSSVPRRPGSHRDPHIADTMPVRE